MVIKRNEPLKEHTTIKIGGSALNYYIPESVEELRGVIDQLSESEYRLLGGGSNLLINDKKTFDNVIQLCEFNKEITFDDGIVHVGASCFLATVIKQCQTYGLGGIEYLYCVPGTMGGAICMNAGRGKEYNKSISDYVIGVDAICIDKKDEQYGNMVYLDKEKCHFSYRDSIFKSGKYLVVGVDLKLDKISPEEITERIKSRKKLVNTVQDRQFPNFGSVFMESDYKIMSYFQERQFGFKNGMKFSSKTRNWILNVGNGSFLQARCLIICVMMLHFFTKRKCKLEVILWKH